MPTMSIWIIIYVTWTVLIQCVLSLHMHTYMSTYPYWIHIGIKPKILHVEIVQLQMPTGALIVMHRVAEGNIKGSKKRTQQNGDLWPCLRRETVSVSQLLPLGYTGPKLTHLFWVFKRSKKFRFFCGLSRFLTVRNYFNSLKNTVQSTQNTSASYI